MARIPGSEKQQTYPSTVAYIAQLILHRYAMLGLLKEDGQPVESMGVLQSPETIAVVNGSRRMPGKLCVECNTLSVIRKAGCDHCTNCGADGACG
jgi:ribonucleoside-diphosphate reductase alpha chain